MKLIIKDSGDPAAGIPETHYEVDCPFHKNDMLDQQDIMDFFQKDIEMVYDSYSNGRISSWYEPEPGQPDWAAVEGKGLDTKLAHWEQPAPPVTLPTDEEIDSAINKLFRTEAGSLMDGIITGFHAAIKWYNKRMKGGENENK